MTYDHPIFINELDGSSEKVGEELYCIHCEEVLATETVIKEKWTCYKCGATMVDLLDYEEVKSM